jgi:hypothetical protein
MYETHFMSVIAIRCVAFVAFSDIMLMFCVVALFVTTKINDVSCMRILCASELSGIASTPSPGTVNGIARGQAT